MFLKEVQRMRKGEQERVEIVKDVNGQILLESGICLLTEVVK